MIYGAVIEENNELVIVAGDSVDEQQNFLTTVQDDNPALMQDTDFSRFLMDSNFSGFKITPTIMEFPSLNDLHEFIGGHDLKIIPLSSGRVQQERMLLNEEFNTKDQRTIAEINGITDEYDPWSNRTEEQKAQAAANKKKMQDKRKAGEVTGDSYGGGKKEEGIRVNDVQITIGEDGAVEIGQVLASKGEGHWAIQHYKVIIRDGDVAAYTDLIKQAGLMNEHDYPCEWERDAVEGIIIHTTKAGGERIRHAIEGIDCTMTEIEGDAPVVISDDWKIADDDLVAVYFRVDIANAKAEDIESVLQAADSRPYIRRNVEGFGCWLAYIRERHAATAIEALSQAGFSASLAEVDRNGDRIIEEGSGAVLIDTGAALIEPPMPWNEGAAEFAALDDKAKRKSLQGKLLLYTVRDYGAPHMRLIHITPMSYFKATGRIWEGEMPIEHLLADGIEKFGEVPGMFQCRSLDLNATDFVLGNKAKMIESLNLRMYANILPDGDQREYDRRAAL